MAVRELTDEETKQRSETYYAEIRPAVEPEHKGEFLVLNLETGEYEMDRDDLTASRRAKARFGDAPQVSLRVGYKAAYHLGGYFESGPR